MGSKGQSGVDYIAVKPIKPAIILYPSLLTPEVITNEERVEVILLGKEKKPIKKEDIQNQLKIGYQLDSEKKYIDDEIPSNWVDFKGRVGGFGKEASSVLQRDGFSGLVNSRVAKTFEDSGYVDLYRCEISINLIKRVINSYMHNPNTPIVFNLIWARYDEAWLFPEERKRFDPTMIRYNKVVEEKGKVEKIIPKSDQDKILRQVLRQMNGNDVPIYCYAKNSAKGEEGQPDNINYKNPIQSYHPVIILDRLNYANYAHITDIHLCARQHAMRRSTAKVIEFGLQDEGIDVDSQVSPEVGNLVNVNLKRLRELLFGEGKEYEGVGQDEDIDVLLIGGDIADYIKSLANVQFENKPTPAEVWNRVEISNEYHNRYQDFVDFVSFYTVIIEFYRKYGKPVFIVSGNHDAYHEPYGISPRLPPGNKIGARANSSIPGDHNMTFFESLLCFGDTYDVSKSKIKDAQVNSVLSFKSEKFEWFYSVFTPFSDYCSEIANQLVINLQWGRQEDVVKWFEKLDTDVQVLPTSHTPTTPFVLTSEQRQFLRTSFNNIGDKNIILNTHFTFVSYETKQPIYGPDQKGHIVYSDFDPSPFDIGTFESNREFLYDKIINNTNVQIILSGHTHRRGLYVIEDTSNSNSGEKSISTKMFLPEDFFDANKVVDNFSRPFILVSDSSGPLPRHNFRGELGGYGRDIPSGTKITFDQKTGNIQSVSTIKTSLEPRFIVTLDYLSLVGDMDVLKKFARMRPHNQYKYHIKINNKISSIAVLDDVIIYIMIGNNTYKIQFNTVGNDTQKWRISNRDTIKVVENEDIEPKQTRTFLALKFRPNPDLNPDERWGLSQYDFDSYWCFPVNKGAFSTKTFWRNKELSEFPDFDWRTNIYNT